MSWFAQLPLAENNYYLIRGEILNGKYLEQSKIMQYAISARLFGCENTFVRGNGRLNIHSFMNSSNWSGGRCFYFSA